MLRKPDPRRSLTQTWHFTADGRLCCGHNNVFVQAKDGFCGVRQGKIKRTYESNPSASLCSANRCIHLLDLFSKVKIMFWKILKTKFLLLWKNRYESLKECQDISWENSHNAQDSLKTLKYVAKSSKKSQRLFRISINPEILEPLLLFPHAYPTRLCVSFRHKRGRGSWIFFLLKSQTHRTVWNSYGWIPRIVKYDQRSWRIMKREYKTPPNDTIVWISECINVGVDLFNILLTIIDVCKSFQ